MSWLGWLRVASAEFLPVTGHAEQPPELDIDAAGWLLGDRAQRFPSVRHSRMAGDAPLGIVWHYTAVEPGVPLWRRIQTYDPKKDRAASWHVLIEADGTLYQSVPFTRGAWHCGKGTIAGHRVNSCAVGVELAGFGKEFTREQVESATMLVRALHEAYKLPRTHAWYGHSLFDPKRRSDPGPEWEKNLLPGILEKAYS